MAGRLVIVRHYEPPEDPEEMADVRGRVFDILFDAATLEKLTRARAEGRIEPGEKGERREADDGS